MSRGNAIIKTELITVQELALERDLPMVLNSKYPLKTFAN